MPFNSVVAFGFVAGRHFFEDDGIPGNNTSRLRNPDGSVFVFENPIDKLSFTTALDVAGVDLTINFVDSLAASTLTVGSLTAADQTPESVDVRRVVTNSAVT